MSRNKLLILCPYPHGTAPSQRFRFEQYLGHLSGNGWRITQKSFISEKTWKILYLPGHKLTKIAGILTGFIKRLLLLFLVPTFDLVFIHREASPLGPPIFEWIIIKLLRKKVIYDFDDAIWLSNTSKENRIISWLKSHSKVKTICKWSWKVSCGNQYLKTFAERYNSSTFLIPTTIDTKYHVAKKTENKTLIIGWTGTHSTEKYLASLVPLLKNLENQYDFIFRVISNHNPNLDLKAFEYVQWNKDSEIDDLTQFDIGVMPLEDDIWAKGKCGFKGLQYMSLAIPTIMSPVGVNSDIIVSGKNGFLCDSPSSWEKTITDLIINHNLRETIGKEGQKTVTQHYSVMAISEQYSSLFSQ